MDYEKLSDYPELSVENYGHSDIVCRDSGSGSRYKVVDIIEDLFDGYKNDEWVYDDEEADGGFCVCGQKIGTTYVIKHCSGIRMTVGSECVKEFSENMYNQITKGSCFYCDTGLTDRRNKYQKDGFCDSKCLGKYKSDLKIGRFTIGFGKHKGKTYSFLVNAEKDYIRWLLDNNIIKQDYVINYLNKYI